MGLRSDVIQELVNERHKTIVSIERTLADGDNHNFAKGWRDEVRRHEARITELGGSFEPWSYPGDPPLPAAEPEAQPLAEELKEACAALSGVMRVLGQLPSCSQDLLGDELYKRVSAVLGWEEPEDETEEDQEEEPESAPSAPEPASEQ